MPTENIPKRRPINNYRNSQKSIKNAVIIKKITSNIDAFVYTVRRHLHDGGLHTYTPACQEKLTARRRALRLQFAEHLDWVIEDWEKVIFSDEKSFSSTDHEKLHCWCPYNTRYNRSNIHEEARSGHVTANMWGQINYSGVGELTEIN